MKYSLLCIVILCVACGKTASEEKVVALEKQYKQLKAASEPRTNLPIFNMDSIVVNFKGELLDEYNALGYMLDIQMDSLQLRRVHSGIQKTPYYDSLEHAIKSLSRAQSKASAKKELQLIKKMITAYQVQNP